MTTFGDYAKYWAKTVLPLKNRKTIRTMKSHIKRLKGGLGSKSLPLDPKDVQRFFTKLSEELQASSVKTLYATFHTIMAQAEREGVISRIPRPVLPKLRRKQQPWFTVDQMQSLIHTAGSTRERALLWILSETGVRISEALSLNATDISFVNSSLSINKSLKTDAAMRVLTISEPLCELLVELLEEEKKKPYPRRLFGGTVPKWAEKLKKTMEIAGVKTSGVEAVAPFHAFRRGNTSAMVAMRVPTEIINQRLGHAHKDLAYSIYNQEPLDDRDYAERLGKLLA